MRYIPMPARTHTALLGSIAKWTAIAAGERENGGGSDCPLCLEFNSHFAPNSQGPTCEGCPVMEATGMPFCEGSPFERFQDAEELVSGTGEDLTKNPDLLALAVEERDFLISLLPKEPTP
jgi:hypothetical protein